MAMYVENKGMPLRKIPEAMFAVAVETFLHPFSNSVMCYSPDTKKLEVIERYSGKPRPEHEGLGLRAIPVLLREIITHPLSPFTLVKDQRTGEIKIERP